MGKHSDFRGCRLSLEAQKTETKTETKAETRAELSPAQEAIKETAEAFVAAFNKGDAKAVATLWSEDGEMSVDGQNTATGRAEIEGASPRGFRGARRRTQSLLC